MFSFVKKNEFQLVLTGFLSLFLELSVIRWLPSNIFSLAYFSNVVLISSFLGISLGFVIENKKWRLFNWFPVAVLVYVLCILFLRGAETIVPDLKNEIMWSFYRGNQINTGWFEIGMNLTLFLVFALNTFLFCFLGQKLSELMKNFTPAKAYTLDILGSISGIVAFTVMSIIGGFFSSPVMWLFVIFFSSFFLIQNNKKYIIVGLFSSLSVVLILLNITAGEIWSPYYSIKTKYDDPNDKSVSIFVNRFFFQKAIDFEIYPDYKKKYEVPYTLTKSNNVLILGAGSGNDVAIAGMNGVPSIDAVEIDPEIQKLGVRLHPNKPYDNPDVHVFIDDARSFLRKTNKKYDIVVMGTLDSHALLSARSTVRLDNFVYTKESLESVREHLSENGVVVLMFSIPKDWLGRKLIKGVQSVYGVDNTLVFVGDPALFNLMIIAGPGVSEISKNHPQTTSTFKAVPDSQIKDISTDDWPYLYIRERKISDYYINAMLILLAFSVLIFWYLRNKKMNIFSLKYFGFFGLGVGFLLLETKSITTASLLFGSTWIVNSLVFTSVLLAVLIANIYISKSDFKNQKVVFGLLILSLLLNYFVPISVLLKYNFLIKSIFSSVLIALPILFASLIFSINWKKVGDIESAYSMNLLGMVFGGILEYLSMIFGINFLYIIAIVIYSFSFWLLSANE